MNEKERKKVKFSLTKFTKKGSFRFVGFGEIDDENLYTKSKTYEDCIRYCHKLVNSTNEFKGSFNEFEEIEFENDKGHLVNLEIEKELKMETINYYLKEFHYLDGYTEIIFNIVDINFEKMTITLAITNQGKISVIEYDLKRDKENNLYFEYGYQNDKIAVDDFEKLKIKRRKNYA